MKAASPTFLYWTVKVCLKPPLKPDIHVRLTDTAVIQVMGSDCISGASGTAIIKYR